MHNFNIHYSFILASILILSVGCYAQKTRSYQPVTINDELSILQLNDQSFLITHAFPWPGNSLVIIDDNSAILIDTPYDGTATQVLLEWIRNQFGDLKISAIVTGFHQDNLGGNEVLVDLGIPVYGMDLTADLVNTQSQKLLAEIKDMVQDMGDQKFLKRYQRLNLTPPGHTFKLGENETKTIEIHNTTLEFYFPGESHTIDNSVVYIPEQKLLFGGCMIRALRDQRPGYLGYANVKAWPESVKNVVDRFPEVEIVVPGHGAVGNQALLTHTVDILEKWNESH